MEKQPTLDSELEQLKARVAELEAALKPFADAATFFVVFPKAFGHKPNQGLVLRAYENASMLSYPHYKTNPIDRITVGNMLAAHSAILANNSR